MLSETFPYSVQTKMPVCRVGRGDGVETAAVVDDGKAENAIGHISLHLDEIGFTVIDSVGGKFPGYTENRMHGGIGKF